MTPEGTDRDPDHSARTGTFATAEAPVRAAAAGHDDRHGHSEGAGVDAESAAALFWLVRNRLYFEQGLAERPDVHLVCYERVVADPEAEIDALARFLGVEDSPERYAHIDRRSAYVAAARPAPAGPGRLSSSSRPALAEIAERRAIAGPRRSRD